MNKKQSISVDLFPTHLYYRDDTEMMLNKLIPEVSQTAITLLEPRCEKTCL